jgi:hypothetical protein
VIDERDFVKAAGRKLKDYTGFNLIQRYGTDSFSIRFHHSKTISKDVIVHGILSYGKAYTLPLIKPTDAKFIINDMKENDPDFIDECKRAVITNIRVHRAMQRSILKKELQKIPSMYSDPDYDTCIDFESFIKENTPVVRMLWHQGLGHPSDHYLYNAHKYIDGVPQFKHLNPVLDRCPVCLKAKQRKEPAGDNSTRTAEVPYQGLSIDFSFSGTKSKDSTRGEHYIGLNKETSYILIVDHFTRRYHGDTQVSKATPLNWIRDFLEDYSPDCPDKYVYMDQGGELYRNPEVRKLFKQFKYEIRPTGADSSNQNGPVECAHLNVGSAIRAMLHGANLPIKFWPYAFHHYIRLKNAIPLKDQNMSPIELSVGQRENFAKMKTFGCRVWVRPTTRRKSKYSINSKRGRFLGFMPGTTQNILWYDDESNKVKIAKHALFDEGMNDLSPESIPPNVQLLERVRQGEKVPIDDEETEIPQFEFRINPFEEFISKNVIVQCNSPTLGMVIGNDAIYNRAYVSSIRDKSSVSKIFSTHRATNNRLGGSYIVSVNGNPTFTADDVNSALTLAKNAGLQSIPIEFAPEKKLTACGLQQALVEHDIHITDPDVDDEHIAALSIEDIRSIATLRHPSIDFSPESISNELLHYQINAIQSDAITD